MNEPDSEIESDARLLVSQYPWRFLLFSSTAVFNSLSPKYLAILFLFVWILPSWTSYIAFFHYASRFGQHIYIKELGFAVSLYLRGMFRGEQVAFLMIWNGIPSSTYLPVAVACYQFARYGRSIILRLWPIAGGTVSLAYLLWSFSSPAQRKETWRGVVYLFSFFIHWCSSMHTLLATYCHKRPFLVKEWRVWELRADAQFRRNLLINLIDDLVEDINHHITNFEYQELASNGHIRLLELTKDEGRNITGNILIVPLAAAPSYSAISYTWGAAEKPHRLTLNGSSLPITASVYAVLQRHTPISGKARLWIDSICINQKNESEKMEQVQMMAQIYSCASEVIVCTAIRSKWDCDIASHFIQQFHERGGYQNVPRNRRIQEQGWKLVAGWGNMQWKSFSKFLHDRYWTRTWIIQEVANARRLRVMLGDREISWDHLSFLIDCFSDEDSDPWLDVPELTRSKGEMDLACIERMKLIATSRANVQSNEARPLKDGLILGIRFDATDTKDHVYGLLGLINDFGGAEILPDYSRSTEHVYVDTSLQLLNTSNLMWVLAHAGYGWSRNLSYLPSWTVDWSTKRRITTAPLMPGSITMWLEAQLQNIFVLDFQKLRIHGICLGRIATIKPIPRLDIIREFFTSGTHNSTPDLKLMQVLSDQWDELKDIARKIGPERYFTHESSEIALWRALSGPEIQAETARQHLTLYEEFIYMHKTIKSQLQVESKPGSVRSSWKNKVKGALALVAIIKEMVELCHRMPENMSGPMGDQSIDRTFAITDKGYMVLAPHLTRVSDEIFLLPNTETPFILRNDSYYPSSPSLTLIANRYRLIGDCYVHGLDLPAVLKMMGQPRQLNIF